MTRTLLTGNAAAAWGARLAGVEYIPAFPITPQTEIIETLAGWIDGGEITSRMTTLESEHSMITAAGAAAVTGVRVFTATSSQGLLYGMEMLYTVAGWRVPLVLVNVSRGLAAPITLEPDHNDVLAARDCGFLQLHCSTCQEVLDSILIGYRVAEDERVRLPLIVNMDGFYLSFTREPVTIPEPQDVDAFLPPYDVENLGFRAGAPLSEAVAVLGGAHYSYFRYQSHLAAVNAGPVFTESAALFEQQFGRRYKAVEAYRCEDAELVFVMLGSFATKAKAAIDLLRESGQAVGLLRPVLLRPFPATEFVCALSAVKGVVVVDQNLSPGKGGMLYGELAAALCGHPEVDALLVNFIGGLGGRDISTEEFFEMVAVTRQAVAEQQVPPARLLYCEDELRELRKLQAIAMVQGVREQLP